MKPAASSFAAGALALALLCVSPLALPAQEPSQEDEGSPTVARWQGEIQRVDGLLRAGSWSEAREASTALVAELVRDLKGGPEGALLLATAYAQRAIAEAGVGDLGASVWSLETAAALEPGFADAPLDAFGAAGARLAEWRREETLPEDGSGALPLDTPGLVPPAIVESPTIVFQASEEVLRSFDYSLQVELVVDAAGRPRRPRVFGSRENPSPIAASLEVLRSWVFEPATLDGRAVPSLVALDLPLTRGSAGRARAALENLREAVAAGHETPPGAGPESAR